ncbi:MAG: XdhC family protein [bacterium]
MLGRYEEIAAALERGEEVAIATLVRRLGSAPGALGSKMFVRDDGTTVGTVGGGCIEADAWQAAVSALRTGQPEILSFSLSPSDAAEGGLICGGTVDVLVEASQRRHLPLYSSLVEALRRGDRAVLGTVIYRCPNGELPATQGNDRPGYAQGSKFLVRSDGGTLGDIPAGAALAWSRQIEARGVGDDVRVVDLEIEGRPASVVLESPVPRSTVYVFGAGHLAKELVPLTRHVGFRVVVVDDRALFANKEQFPEADELIVVDLERAVDKLAIDENSFLVIMTRGHNHDEVLLRQALRVRCGYTGLIGSRTKIADIYKRLRAEGFSQEELETVHAPIGLPIGARSPEEIAISIVAELIGARNHALQARPVLPAWARASPRSSYG